MFIVLFVFFCISLSAYFCHIVKLLIKKRNKEKFSNSFFLLSLPVSVGLITTNYNQPPLSSLLNKQTKNKCQKDLGKRRVVPSEWLSPVVLVRLHLNLRGNPSADNQLAVVSQRPASNTSIDLLMGGGGEVTAKAPKSISGTERQRRPTFSPGTGCPQTVWQLVSSQPAAPTSAAPPREERSRWK